MADGPKQEIRNKPFLSMGLIVFHRASLTFSGCEVKSGVPLTFFRKLGPSFILYICK
jgi:hypothetical protein